MEGEGGRLSQQKGETQHKLVFSGVFVKLDCIDCFDVIEYRWIRFVICFC